MTHSLYHPSQVADITEANCDVATAAIVALASPAAAAVSDLKYRALIASLATITGVPALSLSGAATRLLLSPGYSHGESVEIDFGHRIVGRYPTKGTTAELSAKVDQIIVAMAKAVGRVRSAA